MKALTSRQRILLNFIEESIREKGYAPSYREMMTHFNYKSVGSIHNFIRALKKKGVITNDVGRSRSLTPTLSNSNKFASEVNIPFIGYISAGNPIETFAHTKTLAVPEFLVNFPEKTYILQAKGDSLNEELIADGDFLIIEACQEANAGNTIVALINHHDTIVKRYYPEEPYVHLAGHNPHHKPIILRRENIMIQGIITGVLRLLNKIN